MIDERNQRLTNVRSRLPDLKLPSLGASEETSIRSQRRKAPLIVLLHPPGCKACAAYVAELSANKGAIEEWDGHVTLVLPAAPAAGDATWQSIPFPAFVDTEHRLAAATGVQAPAVIVADQWAEIHSTEPAGADHKFAAPGELAEWAKFLAIQCPECEGESL